MNGVPEDGWSSQQACYFAENRNLYKSITCMDQDSKILVFITKSDSKCDECGEPIATFVTLRKDKGALCMSCADLDHLIFLPSGNTALTRRASKYSTLAPVVLKWSRARKRYERQGLLVEEAALEKAEKECLADDESRARQRERASIKRAALDREYVEAFGKRIRELFPGCPEGTETEIAEHACLKYSGRVGRSAAAKGFDEEAVNLAVAAHIRHAETGYDKLLAQGHERFEAREMVHETIQRVLEKWRTAGMKKSPAKRQRPSK